MMEGKEMSPRRGLAVVPSPAKKEVQNLSPRQMMAQKDIGTARAAKKEDKYANKVLEISGFDVSAKQTHAINGRYNQLKKNWGAYPAYYNKDNSMYVVRDLKMARWKVVMKMQSTAGIVNVYDDVDRPWRSARPWNVCSTEHFDDDRPDVFKETPNPKIKVTLLRAQILIEGREGFNSRLNGIYLEEEKDFGMYPCYKDQDLHKFVFRDQGSFGKEFTKRWVVSNRCGKPLRNRPPVIYAHADEDTTRPYLAQCAWHVDSWGQDDGEVDEQIKCTLRTADENLPPAKFIVVNSTGSPTCAGGYEMLPQKLVHEQPVYRHAPGRNPIEKFLFYNGLKWCIAGEASETIGEHECNIVSAKREAERRRHMPDDAVWSGATLRAVRDACEEKQERFADSQGYIDADFPPNEKSIGQLHDTGGEIRWVRAPDCIDGQLVLFDTIEPGDVMQGALGDCWLLAASACMAEFPGSLEQLFVTKKISKEGKYVMRLWDLNTKDWTNVTVSDMIPCFKRRAWERQPHPAFAQAASSELYTLLLEKAFAKLAGSYAGLKGGHFALAWQAFTGCEEQWAFKRGRSGNWSKKLLQGRPGTPRRFHDTFEDDAADFTPVNDLNMFQQLMAFETANMMMGALIPSEGENKRNDGLVAGHAYSLLKAVDAGGFQLVKLRNPWGDEMEWNGKWCDTDHDSWSQHPEVATACFGLGAQTILEDGTSEADGCFWMEWFEFARIYTTLNICPISLEVVRGSHREEKVAAAPAGEH